MISSAVAVAASSAVVVVTSTVAVTSARVWERKIPAVSSFRWCLRHGEYKSEGGEWLLQSLSVQRL